MLQGKDTLTDTKPNTSNAKQKIQRDDLSLQFIHLLSLPHILSSSQCLSSGLTLEALITLTCRKWCDRTKLSAKQGWWCPQSLPALCFYTESQLKINNNYKKGKFQLQCNKEKSYKLLFEMLCTDCSCSKCSSCSVLGSLTKRPTTTFPIVLATPHTLPPFSPLHWCV